MVRTKKGPYSYEFECTLLPCLRWERRFFFYMARAPQNLHPTKCPGRVLRKEPQHCRSIKNKKRHCCAAWCTFQERRLLEQVPLSSDAGSHACREPTMYVVQCVLLHLAKGTGNSSSKSFEARLLVQLWVLRQHGRKHAEVQY